MLRYQLLLVLVMSEILWIPQSLAINLKDSLKLVRLQNLELAELKDQELQASARAKKVQGAYVSELAWTSSHISDR